MALNVNVTPTPTRRTRTSNQPTRDASKGVNYFELNEGLSPPRRKKSQGTQPHFDIVTALREPLETRLAANEIQEQRKNKNRTIGSITLVGNLSGKDIKLKLEIKTEEIGYGKKGPTHCNYDYSKVRYVHPDGSVCQSEQRKQAEKEMQLPDLPTTVTDTCINPNGEVNVGQNLPVEMTTTQKVTSLTVETTAVTGKTNVQEDLVSSTADNITLNVETVTENSLDMIKVTTNVALNVEMDKQTKNDGPASGLNVETPLTDNTK